MRLRQWGRVLLIFGLWMAGLSALPAVLLQVLPPALGEGFFGLVSIMLTLTVTPLGILLASVGAVLLLVAALRDGRA